MVYRKSVSNKRSRERSLHNWLAAKVGLNIDLDYLSNLWHLQRGRCAATGVVMSHSRNSLTAISIDRIDCQHGYIAGNIKLVCVWANLARSDATCEEFREFLSQIEH